MLFCANIINNMIKTQKEFFKFLETRFTWAPFLKVTNLCNNCCAHCCERSGPDCEPKFIELADIKYILEQFKYITHFNNNVTITGGEPTMAYFAKSPYYIPQLLKYCGKNGYDVYFNTNARWTLSDKAEQIYSDFNEFIRKYNRELYFRLSLDKWHEQCIDANAELINWVVKNKNMPDKRTGLYMFCDDVDIVEQLMIKLKTKFEIDLPEHVPNPKSYPVYKFQGTNKLLCLMPYQGITNMGRAKDNHIATKEPFSKTELYFSPLIDKDNDICFDSNGYALLSANDDDTVKTPYRDNKGRIKHINEIKQELFSIAYQCLCSENQY